MTSRRPTDEAEGESRSPQPPGDGAVSGSDDTAFDRLLQEAAKVPAPGRLLSPGTALCEGRFVIQRRIKRHMFAVLLVLTVVLGFARPSLADDVVDGRTGPGSVYRLVRPTNWNGILVLYAHGYTPRDQPVALPPDAELTISALTPQGFAVAASSFDENGWVIKHGTQRVQRFSGAPAARHLLELNYTPTGDLQIPALTLSTFRDPVVPGFHQTFYGEQVAAMGNADLLVQRSAPGVMGGYGHCTFTPLELAQAFSDLVAWGELGVKPAP